MSYILEALKKAQAERQLGSAPTIHALPLQAGADSQSGPRRGLLWAAVALGALAAAGAAVTLWQRQPIPVPVPTPLAMAPAQPVVVREAPAAPRPALIQPPSLQPPPAPAAATVPVPAPVPAAAAPAEEIHPYQRELPDAVQRELPQLAIGGYIYSKNPADRLLLIDKVLRREGEQVAPGLTLEKLQSKAALMNYRGTRYLIAY